MELFMALRYPLKQAPGAPFVLFTSHRAKYVKGATETTSVDGKSVALYMPPGFQVSDIMRYDQGAGGVASKLIETYLDDKRDGTNNFGSYNTKDIMDVAETFAGGITQAAAGAAAGAVGKKLGGALGLIASGGIANSVASVRSKRRQTSLNPQEFMLFKAPNARQFSFSFNMMPRSLEESRQCEGIIKYFRQRMYPVVDEKDLVYNFPEVFTIRFGKVSGIPKIAESALTNATTSYNPNSMSYFKKEGRPVEIVFTLSFQELMPLTSEKIEEGF